MPTTGPLRANLLRLFVGAAEIGCTRDASFSIARETIDATCKDNHGAKESLPARYSWNVSIGGIFKYNAGYGIKDLRAAILDTTAAVTLKWTTEVSGDEYLQGSAQITSLEETANYNDVATWSATFEGSGLLTKADEA